MPSSRKRPRTTPEEQPPDDNCADCPFRALQPTAWDGKPKKKQKRRKGPDGSDGSDSDVATVGDGGKQLLQMSPFTPAVPFETHATMDMHYAIVPYKKWGEMTRYNSFVLNATKYFCEGFVYVANENTVQREKSSVGQAGAQGQAGPATMHPKKKSDDDWVARILEIRASDEYHVYARVYWMYWPDDLIKGTLYRKKPIKGRQPWHGANELIASNHSEHRPSPDPRPG